MKKILIALLLLLPFGLSAEEIPAAETEILENNGILVHPDSTYVYGNTEIGMRFASNKSVDDIRSWFTEKLGEWSVFEQFGLWAIYVGPDGADFGTVMMATQIAVSENDELPEWHSLNDDMTTEIVIKVAQ